jgi:DNA polymerase III epsilon subunit-like protein
MVKILVFDTETSGLPQSFGFNWNNRNEAALQLDEYRHLWCMDKWPHILQLSYILCDTTNSSEVKIVNNYIDIPETVWISEQSMNIHHISHETIRLAENKKIISDALSEFLADMEIADVVVGHNVDFDVKMIVVELLRLGGEFADKVPDILLCDKIECTMQKMTPICNFMREVSYLDKDGNYRCFMRKKFPKLSEAYEHFFGYSPLETSLHDALVDVILCLRVYLQLNEYVDICCEIPVLSKYVQGFTPAEHWHKEATDDTSANKEEVVVLRRSLRIAQKRLQQIAEA